MWVCLLFRRLKLSIVYSVTEVWSIIAEIFGLIKVLVLSKIDFCGI